MSGIFEHLAATDNTARVAARQAVAVAHKRVSDRVDSFIKSATSVMDFNSRISLVDDDVRRIVSEVVAEYGGDAETIYNSITAGWEDLTRGPDGKWSSPSSEGDGDGDADDIDSELADAPSAVGVGTTSSVPPFLGASAPEGAGGSVEREDLPKGNEDAQDGPSPKIDKSNAGDEKAHKPSTVDSEESKSRNPTDSQKVTDGRGDAEKGTSDRKYEDQTPFSKGTLKKKKLPTGDDNAGFADGGVAHGPNTKTFPKGNQADPVTSSWFFHSAENCPHCGGELDPLEDSDDCEHCGKNINREDTGPEVDNLADGDKQSADNDVYDAFIQRDLGIRNPRRGGGTDKRSAVDPDKNPIAENLNAWTDEQNVQQAIASFERQAYSPVPGDIDPNDDPDYQAMKEGLGDAHYNQKGDSYEPCPHCGTPSERGYPQCETCGQQKMIADRPPHPDPSDYAGPPVAPDQTPY